MKVKKQQFVCKICHHSVSLSHPKCEHCNQSMEMHGDKFSDHISIHNLHRSRFWERDQLYYVFDLSIGSFYINGCTYNGSKGSVMFPSCVQRGRKIRPVRAFGATVRLIRNSLDGAIRKMEGWENKETTEAEQTSAAA